LKVLKKLRDFARLSVLIFAVVALAGCSHISIKDAGKSGKKPDGGATASGDQNGAPSMTGDWQFGFQYNNATLQAAAHIDQQGQQFSGTGKDDQTGKEFAIEQGQISGKDVQFYKHYTTGNAPLVQYTGKLETVNDEKYKGPYMSGEYQTAKNGSNISNIWEAELSTGSASSSGQPAPLQPVATSSLPMPAPTSPAQPTSQTLLNNNPELSGKWNCGYEYNFKTIHSTMFLEQDGDRITGHGVDGDTHEKFVIDKGWYHYPRLTLIRRWPASKQKKGKKTVSLPGHTMIFKATVAVESNADYQGPYLSGKTQGGGNWEAQLYK
jgi:hypothetical protein